MEWLRYKESFITEFLYPEQPGVVYSKIEKGEGPRRKNVCIMNVFTSNRR